jgi:5'-3' exonuclease
MEKTVLIFDGLSVFIRHYVANPSMSSNGNYTGGFVGFLGSIQELSNMFHPSETIVTWEGGGSKKRMLLDKVYKNGKRPVKLNRFYEDDLPETSENRNYQLIKLIEFLKLTPIKQIYVSDCEGDDIISTLVKIILRDEPDTNIVIVSADRDFYQLIGERVKIWSPSRKKIIDAESCINEFGVHPNNIALAKSIVGDVSDNISGIFGVGFKKLSNKFNFFAKSHVLNLQDLIDYSNLSLKNSKENFYKLFLDKTNQQLIMKNLKLVSLDAGSISHDTVKKIESLYNSNETNGKSNKINAYRLLNKEGINKFDVDYFFNSIKQRLNVY